MAKRDEATSDVVRRIQTETERLRRDKLCAVDRQKLQVICTKAAEEIEKKK